MTPAYYLAEKLRIQLDILADAEECRLRPEFIQLVQDPRCHLRARAVVKSKEDSVFIFGK
jgi:hypothetical protein